MALYRSALPEVYGFVLARCGSRELAEDLTADAFLSAACQRLDVAHVVPRISGLPLTLTSRAESYSFCSHAWSAVVSWTVPARVWR